MFLTIFFVVVSGEAPQVPVVSPKSGMSTKPVFYANAPSNSLTGNVFEKRLIEAYIAEHGKDPVNGEELAADELIDIKSQRVVRPRPPTLTSIPSLLNIFQEEWDALALETHTLQQNLAQTRRELSSALYQHDAAVRVIARLTQERDEARDALSKVSVGATRSAAGGEAMQVDSAGLPQAVVELVENTQATYVFRFQFLMSFADSIHLVSLRPAASARSPRAGPPATLFRHSSLLRPRKLFPPAAGHCRSTPPVTSPLLVAQTVLSVSTHCPRRVWSRH